MSSAATPTAAAGHGRGRRDRLGRARPWAAGGALLLVGLAVTALTAGPGGGLPPLDPRSYEPDGAHALARLLEQRGVAVTRVTDARAIDLANAQTVLVPEPSRVGASTVSTLRRSGTRLVLVAPGDRDLSEAGIDAPGPARLRVRRRAPACDDPVAASAGDALAGGAAYEVPDGGTGCYAEGEEAPYVVLDGGRVVLLGSGAALTNAALDREGDAALALGLLGGAPRAVWLVPEAPPAAGPGGRSLTDLLPARVLWAVVAALLALVVLALVRGRRLGRIVAEPLPVVVRAAEVVEGTGRLYASARARGRAADALRDATRRRLVAGLHLPRQAVPEVVADSAARRSTLDPSEVGRLLYGSAPADDAALLALARALDALESEVLSP